MKKKLCENPLNMGGKFMGELGLKRPSEKSHRCGTPIRLIIIVKRSLNQIVMYQEGVMRESIEVFNLTWRNQVWVPGPRKSWIKSGIFIKWCFFQKKNYDLIFQISSS